MPVTAAVRFLSAADTQATADIVAQPADLSIAEALDSVHAELATVGDFRALFSTPDESRPAWRPRWRFGR
jgi:hypothetical protein